MNEKELQTLKNRYDIVGNDPSLKRALETAVSIAPTDLTVLIEGESGVGKEVFPQIIHQNSRRRTGKYFAINCGAIPEGTVDSELFGHEKGAFTGAIESRSGYFEEADGGTLFLDEVAELPLATQARLLRVLQSGEFIRVGSSKVRKTDVRVIAATNVNLPYAVAKGKFRQDLYYRLNTISIHLPALRERPDDIPLLFRKFAADFSEKYSFRNISLTSDAMEMLKAYRWPGNIRQLKSVADRVCALESVTAEPGTDRLVITTSALEKHMPREEGASLPAIVEKNPEGAMSQDEREMIIRTLFQLKRDVDSLKAAVAAMGNTAPAIPKSFAAHESENIEAEEQIQEDMVDAEQQDLSIRVNSEALIRQALARHEGNRKLAAQELGMSERTLYRKLKNLEEK